MRALTMVFLACFLGGCATMQPSRPSVSILVDLDPASTDRTVIVESITADWVLGNIVRVDPKAPKPGVAQTFATATDRSG